ncbi:MAG: hypothetical protein IJP31_04995 [Lachnospiraceae bacterium]|nr:hypothetical protein [Lachnospiraceae bacterium]
MKKGCLCGLLAIALMVQSFTLPVMATESGGVSGNGIPVESGSVPELSVEDNDDLTPDSSNEERLKDKESASEEEAGQDGDVASGENSGLEDGLAAEEDSVSEAGSVSEEGSVSEAGSVSEEDSVSEGESSALEEEQETDAGQTIEQYIYQGMVSRTTKINISSYNITTGNIASIVFGLLNDCPELYYVRGSFSYDYYVSSNRVANIYLTYHSYDTGAFDQAVAEALALVDDSMSDREKP